MSTEDSTCEYCNGTGEIETDNNGPIGPCPVCKAEDSTENMLKIYIENTDYPENSLIDGANYKRYDDDLIYYSQAELDRRVAEAEERQWDSSKDEPLYEPLNLDLMLDDFHDLADSLGKALDDYDGDEGQEECFNKLLRDASKAILNAGGKSDDNS